MTSARVVLLAMVLGLAVTNPTLGQSLPSAVQAAIQENRKSCEPDKLRMEKGFVTRKDINGDGVDDYILDYGKTICGDLRSYFCGSAGCVTQVFASHPDGTYTKVLDENVQDLSFKRIRGRPAMLLGLHGSSCGRMGAADCGATLFWNGQKFSPAN